MKTRTLGRTGLAVPELGLGGYSFRDHRDRTGQLAVVRQALELGITLIDTAAGYGASEETIGLALEGVARDRFLLSTKYYPYGEGDALETSPGPLNASVEQSLRRLRTDHLDLLHLHWVHGPEDVEQIIASPLAEALHQLQASGKVRHLAVSEASELDGTHTMLEYALPTGFFDSVMLTFNVFLQTAHNLFQLARQAKAGVLVMMPLNQPAGGSGLTGTEGARENIRRLVAEGQLPEGRPYSESDVMDFLTRGTELSLPQAAIRFALDQPDVHSVLVGTSRVAHLEQARVASDAPPLPEATHRRAAELFGRINKHVK
jgi:aryl-alcohol dehydrogenase-like predicted oxidoreductase